MNTNLPVVAATGGFYPVKPGSETSPAHGRKPPFPFGLRGPVAADLHRPRFAPPLETSPPRHPFAQHVLL